jgi:ribosomal protein S18 acetylase RimI-like enzyme
MIETITYAFPNDAAAILELQKLAFYYEAKLHGNLNIPPLTQTLDNLRSDFANKTFFKIQVDEKIIGSVRGYCSENTGYIERLITHPDYQGQGIGTALMGKIESCFSQVRRFELFTGQKSYRNIHFYEHLGYKLFRSQKVDETLSFVFMEKYKISCQSEVPRTWSAS